jgi:hypothetical protein
MDMSAEETPEIIKLRGELDALRLHELKRQGVRTFESGATRDTEDGKLDFEAYLSPGVLLRYAQYMQKHQTRSDGTQRDGDDWQQGMPKDVYAKSMLRHLMDFWMIHRDYDAARDDIETALCAIIFNAMGYLFNELMSYDD